MTTLAWHLPLILSYRVVNAIKGLFIDAIEAKLVHLNGPGHSDSESWKVRSRFLSARATPKQLLNNKVICIRSFVN